MEQPVGPVGQVRRVGLAGRVAMVLVGLAAVAISVFVVRRLTAKHPVCGPEIPLSDSTYVGSDSLGKGEMLAGVLARWCLPPARINEVYAALAKTDFNFRNMRVGDIVSFEYRGLSMTGVTYRKDPVTSYPVRFDSVGTTAAKEVKPVDTVRVVVRGAIKGSLWNSMIDLGETPTLIVSFAQVLSYEVDFLTEVNEGDSFEILLDKYYVDSSFYRDGQVYAVRYKGHAGNYSGFHYRSPSGHYDFYNEKGQSLRKSVLRSPLTFANVTSGFGRRFHPISRVYRQHQGVDYGAPLGTPVSAIADGAVVMARWNDGYGNFVQLRHSGGLVSCYGHMSRYGAGVKAGRSVRQGQTVGYVGSTGMSTGPHLHFEVRQGGKPVNPFKVIPPRAEPVASKNIPEFNRLKASYLTDLARPAGPVVAVPDSGEEKRELPLPHSKAPAH
ncbi:MAG: M23 family metallopeptidase [candidate division WOR-3 bacterium]|nr:M23 family metallopeptidase [candidate division WOR-3 bacterium]